MFDTTSLTPARIASSISAGSSAGATMITPVVGMLPLEQRQRGGKVRLLVQVEHEHVGLLRARLRERGELRARRRTATHAARRAARLELAIGRTDEKNVRGHVAPYADLLLAGSSWFSAPLVAQASFTARRLRLRRVDRAGALELAARRRLRPARQERLEARRQRRHLVRIERRAPDAA